MENIHRIIRSIEYIENNLKEPLCLKDIAAEAFFSEFYFHKLFHLLIGDSPGEYIKKRRLFEAALVLKESNAKIIDVAYEFGYNSPEAFSRAFSNLFGFNPIEVKHNQNRIIRYPKPALTLSNLNHIKEKINMHPEIIEKDEMKFVGPVYYGENKHNEISDFWKKHFGIVADLPDKKSPDCFGVCFHTLDYIEKGFFHYMPAIEVENFDFIPIKAVGKIFPKHTYAVFTHRGNAETLAETYTYIYGTYFPNKNFKINEDFDFEQYTTDKNGSTIINIYIPILKK